MAKMNSIISFGPCTTVTRLNPVSNSVAGTQININRDSDVGQAIEAEIMNRTDRSFIHTPAVYTIKDPYNGPMHIQITADTIRIGTYLAKQVAVS